LHVLTVLCCRSKRKVASASPSFREQHQHQPALRRHGRANPLPRFTPSPPAYRPSLSPTGLTWLFLDCCNTITIAEPNWSILHRAPPACTVSLRTYRPLHPPPPPLLPLPLLLLLLPLLLLLNPAARPSQTRAPSETGKERPNPSPTRLHSTPRSQFASEPDPIYPELNSILHAHRVTRALVRLCTQRQVKKKETRPAPTSTVCDTARLPPCNRCGLWVVGCGSAGCWLLHLDDDELSLLKLNSWNSSRAQTHYRPPPDEIR
jgi:hypothetical protein